jgi:hypothetical protein
VTNATSSVDVIAYTSLFPSRPPQNAIHLDIGESVEIIRSDLLEDDLQCKSSLA